VNRDDFEARVLEMWMRTRIPMTRANLQFWTGASRRNLNKRLDELGADGVLEADVDDDGEMVWSVPGATRAIDGPTSFAEHDRRQGIKAEARRRVASRGDDGLRTALTLARSAGALERKGGGALEATGKPEKSLLAGAGLGLLGPLGWLYSGSFKETIPAALVVILVASVLPTFLLMPLMPLILPLSAMVGALYAWQYNKTGERQTLFFDKKKDDGA
jgi:hypothetical protein